MLLTLSLVALAEPLPTELASAAPEARATLDACAADGCTSAEGARAAWLIALHTYVTTGVADGSLAAAVKLLDPALHTELPDVLIEATGTAPSWAQDLASPVDLPILVAAREGTLRPGFYRDFDEMKANAPSLPWTSPEVAAEQAVVSQGRVIVQYALPREARRALPKILGFSDGADVWIAVDGEPRRPGTWFAKITFAGPVGLFATGTSLPLSVGPVALVLPLVDTRVIQWQEGDVLVLNRARVRELLVDRPDLLAAFDDDRDPVFADYLERLGADEEP